MGRRLPTTLCFLLGSSWLACPDRGQLSSTPGHDDAVEDELRAGGLITHGVMAGDVGQEHVVVWARSDGPAAMHVEVAGPGGPFHALAPVDAGHDYTGRLRIAGLEPDSEYVYRVWFGDDGLPRSGRFVTAPFANAPSPTRLVLSGPSSGCGTPPEREAVSAAMLTAAPELLVRIGSGPDPGDSTCARGRKPSTLEDFRSAWRAIRASPTAIDLNASVGQVSVSGRLDATDDSQWEDARRAFFDFSPVDPTRDRETLGRSIRWGQHLELFLLDLPAPSATSDRGPSEDPRRRWLVDRLTESEATWRLVISRDTLDGADVIAESGIHHVVFISAGTQVSAPLRLDGPETQQAHTLVLGPQASGFGVLDVDGRGGLEISGHTHEGERWSVALPSRPTD